VGREVLGGGGGDGEGGELMDLPRFYLPAKATNHHPSAHHSCACSFAHSPGQHGSMARRRAEFSLYPLYGLPKPSGHSSCAATWRKNSILAFVHTWAGSNIEPGLFAALGLCKSFCGCTNCALFKLRRPVGLCR